MPARTFTDDAGRKSACRTRKSEPHNRCQPAAPARAVIPPETPLAKNRTSSRRRLRNFETMAAYERQGGFDGYAARASRGYAAREGLYSAKGYKADKPKDDGWRLSDRLYELSLDAEAREARQKRSEDELKGQLGDAAREIARLKAALDTEQRRTREAKDEARLLKDQTRDCLLYTSPSPRDATLSRMPSSA